MLDDFKLEQPIIYKTLLNSIKKDKITHAYLLELNGYSKGMNFALAFAKFLLCNKHYTNREKCEECSQCQAIDGNNHLEIKIINPDGQWIKKEQLEELQQEFNRKAIVGNKKIYIINGVDKLNISSANSILKFLEDPEEGIIAILLVENSAQALDTIVSRCQVLSFKKDETKQEDTRNKLALSIFSSQEEIEEFLTDEEKKEKVDFLIEYVNFYEKNGLKTIIYKNKDFLDGFSDRKSLTIAFNWLILYYKDALNVNLGRAIEYFNDYQDSVNKTAQKNQTAHICHKLAKLVELIETIKFNANANMLMDRLIIEMEEV